MVGTKPPPGSDEAVKMGCTCPRLDNCWGKHPDPYFEGWVVTEDCPVHGKPPEGGGERM